MIAEVVPAETDAVLARIVVKTKRVLAAVIDLLLGHDPVGRAPEKVRHRNRVGAHERHSIAAQPRGTDDVTREWRSGEGISQRPDSLEEKVAGVQQLAKIPLSHEQRWDRGGALLVLPETDKLLAHE